jgi:SAM-dependent methyltransferase
VTFNSFRLKCPSCGHDFALEQLAGSCRYCGTGWSACDRIITWGHARSETNFAALPKQSRSFLSGLRTALIDPTRLRDYLLAKTAPLHPLRGGLSPLAALSRWRVERYYGRTLKDAALASEWLEAFTSGLNLPPNPRMLDHGGGRGRMTALASQNGFRVFLQEIFRHPWWGSLSFEMAQVVPAGAHYLPWPEEQFDLMIDSLVIHHFGKSDLSALAREARRVIARSGYWVILEANADGYGAHAPRRHYGRLHSLQETIEIVEQAGFTVVDLEYEGFYAPIAPVFFNFLRQVVASWRFDLSDRRTFLPRLIRPEKRARWRLRLRRA